MAGVILAVMFLIMYAGCGKPNAVPGQPAGLGSRPLVPDQPHFPDDSLYVLADPDNANASYYRRLALVQFESSAADADVTAFFLRFSADIVGGVPATGSYYIRFPDPGPSWAQLHSVVQLMDQAPGVGVASEIARVLPKGRLDATRPSSGPSSLRKEGDSSTAIQRSR